MWSNRRARAALILFGSLFLAVLTSCSYGTFFIPKQQKAYAPTDPAQVAVSPQSDLPYPYERLGRVAVSVWGSGDGARENLQEQASKLGANAIIHFRLDRSFGRTAASGLAVRVFSKQ